MVWEQSAQRKVTARIVRTPVHRYREAVCLVLCTFICIAVIQYSLDFLWMTFGHGDLKAIWKYQLPMIVFAIVQYVILSPLGDAGMELLHPVAMAIFAATLTTISVVGGWLWASRQRVPSILSLAWYAGVFGSVVSALLGLLSIVIASLPSQPAPLLDTHWKVLILTVIAGPFVTLPLGLTCAAVYLKIVRPLLVREKIVAEV